MSHHWPVSVKGVVLRGDRVVLLRNERDAVLSHEHKQAGWFPLGEIDALRMPEGYKNSVRRWAQRQGLTEP